MGRAIAAGKGFGCEKISKKCEDQQESSRICVSERLKSQLMPNPCLSQESIGMIRTWIGPFRLSSRKANLRTPATWYSAAASWLPMLLPVHNGQSL